MYHIVIQRLGSGRQWQSGLLCRKKPTIPACCRMWCVHMTYTFTMLHKVCLSKLSLPKAKWTVFEILFVCLYGALYMDPCVCVCHGCMCAWVWKQKIVPCFFHLYMCACVCVCACVSSQHQREAVPHLGRRREHTEWFNVLAVRVWGNKTKCVHCQSWCSSWLIQVKLHIIATVHIIALFQHSATLKISHSIQVDRFFHYSRSLSPRFTVKLMRHSFVRFFSRPIVIAPLLQMTRCYLED